MLPLLALLIALTAGTAAGSDETEAIYGTDDRREVDDPLNQDVMNEAARSVAVVVPRSKILAPLEGDDPTVYRSLSRTTYQAKFNLCPSEPFLTQPAPGYCTAFLVGGDVMVTASHCLKSGADCANAAFVFDFYAGDAHPRPERIKKADVYFCRHFIARSEDRAAGTDFVVFRVDRRVSGRRPLPVRRQGQIEWHAPVTVIGHPNGLPAKIAAGGQVRTESTPGYFVVNSDTFTGSSGSPVLNDDGVVEGVLVRGEEDFQATRTCNVTRRCAEDACRGEDVVRSTTFQEWIPSGILQ